tara:strand:- start:421 stop:687 length:267 start_codon:yes stop_codon:yes gene_type:complete
MPTVCQLRVAIKALDPRATVYHKKSVLEEMHNDLKNGKRKERVVKKKTKMDNMSYSQFSRGIKIKKLKGDIKKNKAEQAKIIRTIRGK